MSDIKSKGLFGLIRERGTVHAPVSITKKDVKNFYRSLKKAEKKRRKEFRKREKEVLKNKKELIRKSRIFNEAIPREVLYHATSIPATYVGSEFIRKYSKWIHDINI